MLRPTASGGKPMRLRFTEPWEDLCAEQTLQFTEVWEDKCASESLKHEEPWES